MSVLLKVLEAARNRAAPDGADPGVPLADMHSLLETAWGLMLTSQRKAFVEHPEVAAIIESGAQGAYTANDLAMDLTRDMSRQLVALRAALS